MLKLADSYTPFLLRMNPAHKFSFSKYRNFSLKKNLIFFLQARNFFCLNWKWRSYLMVSYGPKNFKGPFCLVMGRIGIFAWGFWFGTAWGFWLSIWNLIITIYVVKMIRFEIRIRWNYSIWFSSVRTHVRWNRFPPLHRVSLFHYFHFQFLPAHGSSQSDEYFGVAVIQIAGGGLVLISWRVALQRRWQLAWFSTQVHPTAKTKNLQWVITLIHHVYD